MSEINPVAISEQFDTYKDVKDDPYGAWAAIQALATALSSAAVSDREPYAYEFGRSNGDYTFSVYIERSLPPKPHPDWPVTPLYLAPPPTSELEAEKARLKAELDCALIREGNEKHHAKIAHQNMNAEINARERTEARLAEAMKALEPFAEIAGEAWADGSGWTNAACQNDRICDWFGPSAFHVARRVREGGKVDG